MATHQCSFTDLFASHNILMFKALRAKIQATLDNQIFASSLTIMRVVLLLYAQVLCR